MPLKILQLIYSIFNLFLLNIYLIILKAQKKKIIFFYHPKENLTSIHDFYLSKFSYNNPFYKVIFSSKIISFKHFYLKEILLKYVFFIDIFISNNISNNFTSKSKKIYLHHDIYDTPLVDKKDEASLRKRLLNYDAILLPSKKSSFIFKKIFERDNKFPKILILGFYPKLNYLLKKIKNNRKNSNKIIIAPTHYSTFKNLNLHKYLEMIIYGLIKLNFYVIYRPHPSNIKDEKVKNICKRFNKTNKFSLDTSTNYFKSYMSTKLMITDVSGTAYTYALLTKKPVFFFSTNENIINNSIYKKLNYFKDRKKVGMIFNNVNKMLNFMKNKSNLKKLKIYKKNINTIYRDYFSKKNNIFDFVFNLFQK